MSKLAASWPDWTTILRPLLALILGLLFGSLLCVPAGENPLAVLLLLARSALGSGYDVGMSLFYATPLLFTGLSVALALRVGLFNIGAEGQLTVGALAAVAWGLAMPDLPAFWAVFSAVFMAALAGALWGAIPGMMKAWRGSHEVVTTIMLNFVAAGLTSWITLYFLRDTREQNPQSLALAKAYLLPRYELFDGAPTNIMLLFGLAAAGVVAVFLGYTRLGYQMKAVGENAMAARRVAMPIYGLTVGAMAMAGGLAGMAGLFDVLGPSGALRLGFSADYGFAGIAVAMIGRRSPLGVVFGALLFGALHKGAGDLDFETENITRDLATVLQATVILFVCAEGLWDFWSRRAHHRQQAKAAAWS